MFMLMQQRSEGTNTQQTAGLLPLLPFTQSVSCQGSCFFLPPHCFFYVFVQLYITYVCVFSKKEKKSSKRFSSSNLTLPFSPSLLVLEINPYAVGVFLIVAQDSTKKCVLEDGFTQRSRAWDLIFQLTTSQLCIQGKYLNLFMPQCFFV